MSRTYLSIGDVLTLLREEFPDVTISKIRFLESQGLVNPERSPSGYRKFFDHDVERLRWVLRQQREHFLPLKVIRDRLADGELDDGAVGPANGKETAGARAAEPVHAGAAAGTTRATAGAGAATGAAGAAGAAVGPTVAGAAALRSDEPTKADEEAMARILADASRRAALLPDDAQARRTVHGGGDDASNASVATATAARGEAPAGADAQAHARRGGKGATTPAGSRGTTPAADAPARAREKTAADATTGASRGGGGNGSSRGGSTGGQGGRKAPAHAAGEGSEGAEQAAVAPSSSGAVVTGASLTAEELASASGLSPEEVAGLVSFGLIEPVLVAGIESYDEDALTVANLASSFRVYGIEPRHLRMYRNAVDREIGLIEQVVIPLLRQRNPESRQRAGEAAEELGTLGQSMRATLLRQGLRRHLGG